MNKYIDFNKEWELTDGEHHLSAHIPGDITDDMYQAGFIDDPYYGENHKYIGWIQEKNWLYSNTFTLLDIKKDKRIIIVFKGIDTYSDILLNDKLILSTDDMFMEYKIDISDFVVLGTNKLVIKMKSVYDYLKGNEDNKYISIFNQNRLFIRKSQCHFGWDWAPSFPGYGIYKDVCIYETDLASIEDVWVKAKNNGEIRTRILLDKKASGKITVKIKKDSNVIVSYTKEHSGRRDFINLKIENPLLWYPIGYGEQPIYECEVIFETDTYKDNKTCTFAFREIELLDNAISEISNNFGFSINGRKCYMRGSNWVPIDLMTGRIKKEKYEELLKAAKDANFNMLRVWGGGLYEPDYFYELCDKYGIAIWQDFMFSCSMIPEDNKAFMDKVYEETEQVIMRLRNHPSIIYWCGMNENSGAFNDTEETYSYKTLHFILRGMVQELDGTRPYGKNSPYSFLDVQDDDREGDCHRNISEIMLFGKGFNGFDETMYDKMEDDEILNERIRRHYLFLPETLNNFSSECAALGLCSYDSLKKFTPDNVLTLDSKFIEERFLGNPYTYVMPMFFERQKVISNAMFGEAKNIEDLCIKTNLSQAELIRSEVAYARTSSLSNGILTWMYSDIWPTGTWSLIDYYHDKKPIYYTLKRCFKPVFMDFIRNNNEISIKIVNNSMNSVEDTIVVSYRRYNGDIIKKELYDISLDVDEVKEINLQDKVNGVMYLSAKGFDNRSYLDLYRYYNPKYEVSYNYEIVKDNNDKFIQINAKSYLPIVNIIGAETADNYFDMDKGDIVKIKILSRTYDDIKIKTLADYLK